MYAFMKRIDTVVWCWSIVLVR